MSKFEQICEAYANSRKSFRNYEETCRKFARNIVFGLIDYYEWPHDQEITYIPLGEEITSSNRFYALAGAMQMDSKAFWHFGVELIVEDQGGSNPLRFLMSFFIKKVGSHFIVKLGVDGREIKIHEDRQGELEPFYDAVFVQIMDFFKKRYQDAVTNQQEQTEFIILSPTPE